MPMMRIPTPAMLGKSRLLRVAKDKAATKEMRTGINLATSKIKESTTVRGIASKRKVAEVRAKIMRPKPIPSVQETGQIRHPKNAWRKPKMPANYMMAPHQTSSWSKQKSPTDVGNYLAWKYKGFPKSGY
jgi:hypothetical protein